MHSKKTAANTCLQTWNWLKAAMEPSQAQSEQILADLAQFILEQGGTITSEKLGPFYFNYPGHRGLVKNMRSFCEQHPDRISISSGHGDHYRLQVSIFFLAKTPWMLQEIHFFYPERDIQH